MTLLSITTLITLSALNYSIVSHAQATNYHQYYNQSTQQQKARQALQYQEQIKMQKFKQQAMMTQFPSALELKKIAPQPVTEAMLQQRLDKQLLITTMQLSIDKKQADTYAENFSRLQQQQADSLKNMMRQADFTRQRILMRTKKQHEYIMSSFKKSQISKDTQNK